MAPTLRVLSQVHVGGSICKDCLKELHKIVLYVYTGTGDRNRPFHFPTQRGGSAQAPYPQHSRPAVQRLRGSHPSGPGWLRPLTRGEKYQQDCQGEMTKEIDYQGEDNHLDHRHSNSGRYSEK